MQDEREKNQTSQTQPGRTKEDADRERPHPAGPHARRDLTNEDATPGSGSLPDDGASGGVDPAGG